ncbi:unnamed protein product [Amoebophrya sp. A120]|nr:unnamed protein product [Amoebophrya sp. A120]|eukprot:GSA120T00016527001.1
MMNPGAVPTQQAPNNPASTPHPGTSSSSSKKIYVDEPPLGTLIYIHASTRACNTGRTDVDYHGMYGVVVREGELLLDRVTGKEDNEKYFLIRLLFLDDEEDSDVSYFSNCGLLPCGQDSRAASKTTNSETTTTSTSSSSARSAQEEETRSDAGTAAAPAIPAAKEELHTTIDPLTSPCFVRLKRSTFAIYPLYVLISARISVHEDVRRLKRCVQSVLENSCDLDEYLQLVSTTAAAAPEEVTNVNTSKGFRAAGASSTTVLARSAPSPWNLIRPWVRISFNLADGSDAVFRDTVSDSEQTEDEEFGNDVKDLIEQEFDCFTFGNTTKGGAPKTNTSYKYNDQLQVVNYQKGVLAEHFRIFFGQACNCGSVPVAKPCPQKFPTFTTIPLDAKRYGFDLQHAWVTFQEPEDVSGPSRFVDFVKTYLSALQRREKFYLFALKQYWTDESDVLLQPAAQHPPGGNNTTTPGMLSSSNGNVRKNPMMNSSLIVKHPRTVVEVQERLAHSRPKALLLKGFLKDHDGATRVKTREHETAGGGNPFSTTTTPTTSGCGAVPPQRSQRQPVAEVQPLCKQQITYRNFHDSNDLVPIFALFARANLVQEFFAKAGKYTLRSDYSYSAISSFLVKYFDFQHSLVAAGEMVPLFDSFGQSIAMNIEKMNGPPIVPPGIGWVESFGGGSCGPWLSTARAPAQDLSSCSTKTKQRSQLLTPSSSNTNFHYFKSVPLCQGCNKQKICHPNLVRSSVQIRDMSHLKANFIDKRVILPQFNTFFKQEPLQHQALLDRYLILGKKQQVAEPVPLVEEAQKILSKVNLEARHFFPNADVIKVRRELEAILVQHVHLLSAGQLTKVQVMLQGGVGGAVPGGVAAGGSNGVAIGGAVDQSGTIKPEEVVAGVNVVEINGAAPGPSPGVVRIVPQQNGGGASVGAGVASAAVPAAVNGASTAAGPQVSASDSGGATTSAGASSTSSTIQSAVRMPKLDPELFCSVLLQSNPGRFEFARPKEGRQSEFFWYQFRWRLWLKFFLPAISYLLCDQMNIPTFMALDTFRRKFQAESKKRCFKCRSFALVKLEQIFNTKLNQCEKAS